MLFKIRLILSGIPRFIKTIITMSDTDFEEGDTLTIPMKWEFN